MIRRRTLLAAALSMTAFPALALDRPLSPEETQLVTEIGTHNSAIRTMVGRFLQIDQQGQRSEGTFYLERPNNISFRYNPPSRDEIVSQGRGFYVINRRDKTAYAYPQEQIPLRQFLQDDIDFLNKTNIVDVITSNGYMTIVLADDTPIGNVEVSLVFDTATKDLKQWTLTEPSGAELTFSLFDVETGVEIPRAFFTFDITWRAPDRG
jgi:outer membrane lipoprotein-sorting protein